MKAAPLGAGSRDFGSDGQITVGEASSDHLVHPEDRLRAMARR